MELNTRDDGKAEYVPALRFRWLTPAYDVVVRSTTRERTFKAALIEQAGIAAGQRVLDLACGTGTLSIGIKQRCPQATVTGIDGDPDILAIASRKAAAAAVPIQLDHGLSWQLPYPDTHFDCVVSSLFFHHLCWRDKERTARELFRVLRPGGQLHVADWGCPTGPVMRAAFVTVQLLDGFANTRDNVQGKLMSLFEGAGFGDVAEASTFSTVLGTLALYRAVKPTGAHHD